ncbi:MAG: J domain-containing protein [Ardenticatenaceae bacterium]|nr:J domain-containing protein [Ardenticatenaceae bacterium]
MHEKTLTHIGGDWRERVARLQKLLQSASAELIDAETELADRLAAINAFEFKLRAATSVLVSRLDQLESEIRDLRLRLRQQEDEWGEGSGGNGRWSVDDVESVASGQGPQASGGYRYRDAGPDSAPQKLNEDQGVELKRLYRQLARRFHPDLAVDPADRDYRTQLMIAINAAYVAGDLEKLRQLALEPESVHEMEWADSDQQLAEMLLRELERCRRRLAEIQEEMERLEKHKSARLMKQAAQAEANGRDWAAEIKAQLQEQIARKMVERDVLKQEVEFNSGTESLLDGDAYADAVWEISLEYAFEEDPDNEAEAWTYRRRNRYSYDDDDILDDLD